MFIRFSFLLFTTIIISFNALAAPSKVIHVFVALCDNQNQGIVPVPESLGNGQNPKSNLYWGAMFGVKSFFRYKTSEWIYLKSLKPDNPKILERIVFKHKTQNAYLVADAYNGLHIKSCTEDFLLACNGQQKSSITIEEASIGIGGNAELIAYCGHDGLMEFDVNLNYRNNNTKKDAIILACVSKEYFNNELKQSGANPLVWTTQLMAPEAYTLKAAIDGWLLKESNAQVKERAAQAYNKYQKCGINGARGLFATGY